MPKKLTEYPIATPSQNDLVVVLHSGLVRLAPINTLSTGGGASIFTTPSGKCPITKMYVNPSTGKLEIEYETTPIE
jgi:hypothetical protein